MDTPITRAEHEEFRNSMLLANKNMEDENKRQNKRLDALEENVRQITELAVSVRELAVNMQNMTKELGRQGDCMEQQSDRLKKLEDRDGEMWRKVTGYIITAVISIVVGFLSVQI